MFTKAEQDDINELANLRAALTERDTRISTLTAGIERVYRAASLAQASADNQTLTRLAFGNLAIQLNELLALALALPGSPETPKENK